MADRGRLISILILPILLQSSLSVAQESCDTVFERGIVLSDYNENQYHRGGNGGASGLLESVERRHFTPKVERLISGESTTEILGDLDYTLGKFPNHHRALLALVRYDRKLGGRLPSTGKPYPQTVECYFQRALEFRPQDGKTLQVLGMYHHMNDRFKEAIDAYQRASEHMNSAELHYNMGLTYVELEEYAKAKEHALQAYNAGYPLPGLKNRLARNGVTLD